MKKVIARMTIRIEVDVADDVEDIDDALNELDYEITNIGKGAVVRDTLVTDLDYTVKESK